MPLPSLSAKRLSVLSDSEMDKDCGVYTSNVAVVFLPEKRTRAETVDAPVESDTFRTTLHPWKEETESVEQEAEDDTSLSPLATRSSSLTCTTVRA